MSMAGYTKLFNSILASSVWCSSKDTKILWITLLAMAGKDGIAETATPGLARIAGLTVEETERGLKELASPDAYSRTKEHEGRRIEAVDGGWLILNHPKYRAKMGADERREYKAQKQREYRAAATKKSTSGHRGHNAEAKAKADTNGTTTTRAGKKVATLESQQALQQAVTELAEVTGSDYMRVLERATSGHLRTGKKRCEPCLSLGRISQDHADRTLLDVQTALAVEKSR